MCSPPLHIGNTLHTAAHFGMHATAYSAVSAQLKEYFESDDNYTVWLSMLPEVPVIWHEVAN